MSAPTDQITIAVLAGTTRAQRLSIHAARLVARVGESLDNVRIIFVDPLDFSFAGDGNDPEGKDPRYTDIVAQADAFFIVTPEYNHGYPGSLKRMLDSEYSLYRHKPVAFAGVSNGGWGGVRCVEALVPVVRTMGLVASSSDVYFPRVQDLFAEGGELLPEHTDRYQQSITVAYTELTWLARALKAARTTVI